MGNFFDALATAETLLDPSLKVGLSPVVAGLHDETSRKVVPLHSQHQQQ